jgi:dihydroorotase
MSGITLLKNFRLVDEETDMPGSIVIRGGLIQEILPENKDGFDSPSTEKTIEHYARKSSMVIDGKGGIIMPAFVDLHAHFRDPGFPEKENLESASLAAAAGGFGTVVCMANTKPVIDTAEKAADLRRRSGALGLIDLWPALSLSQNMEGKELSGIVKLAAPPREQVADSARNAGGVYYPRLLSEDGKDVRDDGLLLAAFREARRLGIPVSCHCDAGGSEADEAKKQGKPRSVWSRIEENNAVRRAIALGKEASCHVHIAHISTKESADLVRRAKARGFSLSCEAAPHHIYCTEEDALRMGDESYGRVNPPLRAEEDRQAILAALADGTVDAIATDHAPHCEQDKLTGAPGFTGLETAFAVCYTALVRGPRDGIDLRRLSALMSANPGRLLGFNGERGRILPGSRADLVIVDTETPWTVNTNSFKSRGHCSPVQGRVLYGKIIMTVHAGHIVFSA